RFVYNVKSGLTLLLDNEGQVHESTNLVAFSALLSNGYTNDQLGTNMTAKISPPLADVANTPVDCGSQLYVGRGPYQLKAVPGYHEGFKNWTELSNNVEVVVSTSPTYAFTMKTNLQLTAHFVHLPWALKFVKQPVAVKQSEGMYFQLYTTVSGE